MIIGGVGPMIPALGRQCDASLTEMKYVFPTRALGIVLGAMLGGVVYDMYPGAPLLAMASLGMGLFQFVAALSHYVWMLSLTFFAVGLCGGLLDTGINTLLVWVWQDEVAPYMSTMHFFFGVGAFISPLVTAFVLELAEGDIKPAMFIQSVVCIPVAVFFYCTKSPAPPPPSPPSNNNKTIVEHGGDATSYDQLCTQNNDNKDCCSEFSSDDVEGSLCVMDKEASFGPSSSNVAVDELASSTHDHIPLMNVNRGGGGGEKEPAADTTLVNADSDKSINHSNCEEKNGGGGGGGSYARNLDVIVAVFVSVFLALSVGSEVSYGGWISTYTMTALGSSETTGAYVTSVYWGSFTFGRLISIPISSRISPQLYLLIDLVLGLIGTSFILIAESNMVHICIGSTFIGLSIASMFPSCVSLPPSLGLSVSGKLTSYFVVGSSIGELLIPFIEGAAIENFGSRALIVCCLIVMLLMCSLLGALFAIFKVFHSK
jgi:MFS transporter, FHS family, Na+ dependent glucose transporter 1